MGSNSIRLPIDGRLHLEVEDHRRAPTPPTISLAIRVRRWPGGCGSLIRLVINRQSGANGTELIVRVSGDIDLVTAPTLAEALDRARRDLSQLPGVTELVVDLRSVPFLSAAGMRALVDAQDACTADGTSLRVVADQTAVTRPLALTRLDRLLDLRATLIR